MTINEIYFCMLGNIMNVELDRDTMEFGPAKWLNK